MNDERLQALTERADRAKVCAEQLTMVKVASSYHNLPCDAMYPVFSRGQAAYVKDLEQELERLLGGDPPASPPHV